VFLYFIYHNEKSNTDEKIIKNKTIHDSSRASNVKSIKNMKINIINKSQHALPNYETIASAGMDLRANLPNL
jgi:hypothetical protein